MDSVWTWIGHHLIKFHFYDGGVSPDMSYFMITILLWYETTRTVKFVKKVARWFQNANRVENNSSSEHGVSRA